MQTRIRVMQTGIRVKQVCVTTGHPGGTVKHCCGCVGTMQRGIDGAPPTCFGARQSGGHVHVFADVSGGGGGQSAVGEGGAGQFIAVAGRAHIAVHCCCC